MDFRIRQLQCFLTLAEHLHYGRTARALYMSQPTITFQIKSLEQAFGVALFERSRQQVSLTPAGEAFRAYAARIVGTVADARRHLSAVQDALCTSVRMRVSCGRHGEATLLPEVLRTLARHYPGLILEIMEMSSVEQSARLAEGSVDALLMVPCVGLAGVRFDPLQEEPLVALLSRESALAERRTLSVADLRGEILIAPRLEDCAARQPFLRAVLAPYGIVPHFLEVPASAQMAYVAAGEGIVLGPRPTTTDHPDAVVVRPFQEALPRLQLGLAALSANASPALAAFRSVVLQCAGKTMRESLSTGRVMRPEAFCSSA